MSGIQQDSAGSNGSDNPSASWSGTPAAETEQRQQQTPNAGSYYEMDWGNSILGPPDFSNLYQPQGVLLEDPSDQRAPAQGFTIPSPVVTSSGEQSNPNTAPDISAAAARSHGHNQLKRKADPNISSGSRSAPSATPAISIGEDARGPSQKRATVHAPEDESEDKLTPENPSSFFPKHKNESRPPSSSLQSLKPVNGLRPTPPRRASGGEGVLITDPPGILRTIDGKHHLETDLALPHDKVFPIQIGSELFRLSGASLSSDAPSYFSQFFRKQLEESGDNAENIRTLYIDRDPVVFRDISLHLQGYYVQPRDVTHYVKLFSDAQFYSLPRLISQLFESEIFVEIGGRSFQIPRDIFSGPGDSPNFFSLGFGLFFSTPARTFPGLDRVGLLRPPSIQPPNVPNRSADTFADLIHLLRGYPVHIRNEEHRAELIRDCRYFHLRGLEQKLIPHHISFNAQRHRSEIVIRLEDVKPSGILVKDDPLPAVNQASPIAWVNYARPFADGASYELVLQISGESTRLNVGARRADFHGKDKARISSLFQVIANKMNLPVNQPLGLLMMSGGGVAKQPVSPGNTPLSEDLVKIQVDKHADIILDGEPYRMDHEVDEDDSGLPTSGPAGTTPSPGWSGPRVGQSPVSQAKAGKKIKRRDSREEAGEWIVRTGQWRLRVQPCQEEAARGRMELVLVAVKLDAYSGQLGRNRQRPFLTY
ncbi:hypothetical protein L228DRAFT_85816 [Xylona heveae TC161]|uniref:Potassium channel tetramerisation-type BTB domain-containing protein n=1 Tax=Xylona heveae (strain CBS 132557 / TC161) TaxID=1328760 RepID=A0A161TP87_XYLHT|nr:hypothetical protein L228DRAFT_85816 [Xylona heveae TC161]KZF23956.1 hypothetical protein L228DRAFT_85816 [Xylona heveae TC161]